MKRACIILCVLITEAASILTAQVSTDYRITMSDGVHLEATLTTPSTAPPAHGYPLVVFIHGLGGNKDDIALISTLLTGRGYASFLYDVRGQGSSEGMSTIMGSREVQDLREILAFLDTVANLDRDTRGIAGGSQGGVHAWLAAIHRMQGVRTVATLVAPPSYATDLMPDNCLKQQLCFELTLGSVRYDPMRDRLRSFVINEQYDSVRAFLVSRDLTPLLDSIQVPVIQSLGWADVLFPANSAIVAAQSLTARSVPIWSYIGTNGHGEAVHIPEYLFSIDMILRWFDHWLVDSALADAHLPRMVLADDRPAWPHREIIGWPPQPAGELRLYLGGSGLKTTPPSVPESKSFSLRYDSTYSPQQAWDERYLGEDFRRAFRDAPVRFVSVPVLDTLDVTGVPRARLFLRSGGTRFQAHVRLFDVAESDTGFTWTLVTRCPVGVLGSVPGVTVEKAVEGHALSHRFPPGHRVGVEISSLDMWDSTRAHIIPYFESTEAELVLHPSYPSYIDLPLVGSALFTSIEVPSRETPAAFALSQNYPNPFNPSTMLRVTVHEEQAVALEVFAITGQRVATLLKGRIARGEYDVPFHARGLASGMYIARLTAGGASRQVSMLLIR
ncbi:MAG: alpha/beta fold hydrolase [Bacteroidetes bacterium]|nr:alpha/beta fold hydrolase [Bacteroidota bacterium]